jgi:hypothetical protein
MRTPPEVRALDREHFFMITLDSKNRTIGYHTVSIGSLSTSIVHPRECFKAAVLDSSAAVIFPHNITTLPEILLHPAKIANAQTVWYLQRIFWESACLTT